MPKGKDLYIVLGCIAIILVFLFYVGYTYYDIVWAPTNPFKEIHIGMKMDEIINRYGSPTEIAKDKKILEESKYYKAYYPRPERKISNQVLIYQIGPMHLLYLYIDNDNLVEYIHWAKT